MRIRPESRRPVLIPAGSFQFLFGDAALEIGRGHKFAGAGRVPGNSRYRGRRIRGGMKKVIEPPLRKAWPRRKRGNMPADAFLDLLAREPWPWRSSAPRALRCGGPILPGCPETAMLPRRDRVPGGQVAEKGKLTAALAPRVQRQLLQEAVTGTFRSTARQHIIQRSSHLPRFQDFDSVCLICVPVPSQSVASSVSAPLATLTTPRKKCVFIIRIERILLECECGAVPIKLTRTTCQGIDI